MKFQTLVYKSARKTIRLAKRVCSFARTKALFYAMNVENEGFKSYGVPIVDVRNGRIRIRKNFRLKNGLNSNTIGFSSPCVLVADNANLTIGNNVGLSQTALVACGADIVVGDNVLFGSGVKVYTTDFHSLDYMDRRVPENLSRTKSAPVCIGNDVFIGAGSMILKGVSVGDRAIIGAGSVVSKNVPSDEIWAGNPAKCVRKIDKD